jgi:signal transduction histidine kinase
MSWLTVIWSMAASGCVTLGLMHLLVWVRQRADVHYLLFTIAAFAIAGVAIGELWLMYAITPEQFAIGLRWIHLPLAIMTISLVGFVRTYLRSGRAWLAGTVIVLRIVALIVNFAVWPNLNYREITALHRVHFFGAENASVAVGVPSHWMLLGQAVALLFCIFVIDAAVSLWRRGNAQARRRALLVGGTFVFAVVFSFIQSQLVLSGIARQPYLISLPFLVPMFAMGCQLVSDVVRSAELANELRLSRTELRRAQRDLAQRRNELAHLSRVTMLGELSGSLAHELNQPLTAILSNAQAAQRFIDNDKVDRQEVHEILSDIIAADNRAGETIHRLRMLFKNGEVQNQRVDLNSLVREVLKFLNSDLINRMVKTSTGLSNGTLPVQVDQVQIQQVLINLIVNACDAMANSSSSARKIHVSSESNNGDVQVSIHDRGSGIAPDQIEKIFEPFFTTKPHGMGLGLAVCRTIVSAHGGKLWATNNPDGGATFHLALPAVHSEVVNS